MFKLYFALFLIIGLLVIALPLFVLYFIIKRAVRNGTYDAIMAAYDTIKDEEDCIK